MRRLRIVGVLLTLVVGTTLGLLAYTEDSQGAGRLGASAASFQDSPYAVRNHKALVEASDLQEAPAGTAQTTTLIVDDGTFELLVGLNQPGTIWIVNRLQPPSYPATLSQLQIYFAAGNSNLAPGSAITLLVGSNPDGDENVDGTSFQQVPATIQALNQFNTYSVPSLTINSGDFVVGFHMQVSGNQFPGALDTNPPSRRRSYVSTNGFNFDLTENPGDMVPSGNFGIRAVVNLQQAILSVNPTSLTFNAVVGQGNPPAQSFTVTNVGSGLLSFSVTTSNSGLANASPTNGTLGAGQSQTITVFVTNPNQPGTQQAFLTVNAPNAQGSPQTVVVTVNTSPPPAVLNVTPTSLTFNTIAGQGNPAPQSFIVQNTGGRFLNFTITSNSGFVNAFPTSGTLGSGQATTVQVSVINPNSPGTITAQLTVNANALNSPQIVNVTINTQPGGPLDEGEPNDSPQSATNIPALFSGGFITFNGNGRPGDTGTEVDQVMTECLRERLIQDWFRLFVTQRDAFQVQVNFDRMAADFDLFIFIQTGNLAQFPEGVQLIASSARGPGQAEAFSSRVLEPGTYFIGISRVRRNALSDLVRASYTLTVSRGLSPEVHAIEDVACVGFADTNPIRNGNIVVNRFRPTRYPARLRAISILLSALPGQPSPDGRTVRIIAFTDPSGRGVPPFNPPLVVNQFATITLPPGSEAAFNTLDLGNGGPVIFSGDFYVGYVIDTSKGIFPNLGRVIYPHLRSFVSTNGGQTYQQLEIQDAMGRLFNVAVRAVVETMPFGKLPPEDSSDFQGDPVLERIRPRIVLIDEP